VFQKEQKEVKTGMKKSHFYFIILLILIMKYVKILSDKDHFF